MIAFDCRLERTGFTFDAAFEAGPGVTALFGPSGSGKSTAIRLLAGLERPSRGRIDFDGTPLLDTARGLFVPPHRRRTGLVFQDALLLPHLSVAGNLRYGRFFTPAAERRIPYDAVVDVLAIGHLLARRPATLSGGERQRVAIGRALMTSPRLLLMDEPLAALDGALKLEILPFVERLRDEFAIPIVYVTHAVEEVARLAARVVRFEAGRVAAVGQPAEVLLPATLDRALDRFGTVSVLTARFGRHLDGYGLTVLDHPAGEIVVPGRVEPTAAAIRVAIPATAVTLSIGRRGNLSVRTALSGRVAAVETDAGPFALVTLDLPGGDVLKTWVTRHAADGLGLGAGDTVQALVKAVTIDERSVPGLRVVTD